MRTITLAILILSAVMVAGFSPGVTDSHAIPWEKELRHIASGYTKYGRVDQLVRWSPLDCRAPSAPTLRVSRSDDAQTHGQKLYTIFAKIKAWEGGPVSQSQTYLPPLLKDGKGIQRESVPVGQVIVKEAWEPVEVTAEERHADKNANPFRGGKVRLLTDEKAPGLLDVYDYADDLIPYAHHADTKKHYKAGRKAALFIMFRLEAGTPGTDEGWVYGTVSGDGQTVTAAGRLSSCMHCHQQAPHDRLFGLK